MRAKVVSQKQLDLNKARSVWYMPSWGLWALMFVGALLVVGIGYHRAAVINTPEVDAYFLRADALMRGEDYTDPYRPPLYAALMALMSTVSGISTFQAGIIISAVATGGTLLLALQLACLFLDVRGRIILFVLLSVDPIIVQHGLFASTDALFCLFTLSFLLVALDSSRRSSFKLSAAIALGILLGLAYLTRYTAATLGLVVVYVGLRVANTWRTRLIYMGVAFTSAAVCASPWLFYNTILNGSPLYNENWRNFALAVYGGSDFTYLTSTSFTGYADVFLHNPLAVIHLWITNIVAVAWAIPTMHSSSAALALCLPIGVFTLWRRVEGRLLLLYGCACVLPVVAAFSYMPRLLLPVTPIVIMVAVIGFTRLVEQYQLRTLVVIVITVMLVVFPVRNLVPAITYVVRYQPIAELDQLDDLVAQTSPLQPLRVVSTYRFLGYFSQHPERVQQSWVPAYSKQYPQNLLDTVRAEHADYVLISDLTAERTLQNGVVERVRPACWSILREAQTPTGSVRLYRNDCKAS